MVTMITRKLPQKLGIVSGAIIWKQSDASEITTEGFLGKWCYLPVMNKGLFYQKDRY